MLTVVWRLDTWRTQAVVLCLGPLQASMHAATSIVHTPYSARKCHVHLPVSGRHAVLVQLRLG